jgi:hypothetical protein
MSQERTLPKLSQAGRVVGAQDAPRVRQPGGMRTGVRDRCRRGGIILSVWLLADVVRHHMGGQDIPAFLTMLATVTLASFAFIVYFIISEKLYEEMLGSVMISLVLMGLTAIFFPFGILLFFWVLYNIVRTLKSMVGLLIPAVLSLLTLTLLFPVLIVENTGSEMLFLARPIVMVGPLLGERWTRSLSALESSTHGGHPASRLKMP